jgi:hypothetical protein
MRLHRTAPLIAAVLLALALPAVASAARYGSRLGAAPNIAIGCDRSPIYDPITGVPTIAPTGQSSCTMRNAGYLFTNRGGSFVPSNGRVTRIRVRSGPNPARLRLTVMQGSPGLCCTARYIGPSFRPRANKITSREVNVRVYRTIDDDGTQVTDVVGLSASGAGTLPLRDERAGGRFRPGSGLTQLWYPRMAKGDPRVEGQAIDGLELLFQWSFKPR